MAGKTLQQLELDVNATLRQIFTHFEELAQLPPEQAAEPYSFNARMRAVRRQLWELHRNYIKSGAGREVPRGE